MRLPPVILANYDPASTAIASDRSPGASRSMYPMPTKSPPLADPWRNGTGQCLAQGRAVAARHPKALVIGGDTGRGTGQALLWQTRRSWLRPLVASRLCPGKTHQVITGVTLIQWSTRRCLLQAKKRRTFKR